MTYERPRLATVVERLEAEPRRILAVVGPRQIGKTTLIRQALRRTRFPSRYFAVDEPVPASGQRAAGRGPTDRTPVHLRDADWLADRWCWARAEAWTEAAIAPEGGGFVLVFDEIRKAPGWPEAVRRLWDEDRRSGCPLRVVLSASSPLTLQHDLGGSLEGRFDPIRLTQWSLDEMRAAFDFDLDRFLFFGGYPGAAADRDDPVRWRRFLRTAIVNPTVERGVLGRVRVDQPALLTRLYWSSVRNAGRIVPYRWMLAELRGRGHTATLARYLDLLGRSGLVAGLSRYDGDSSPKPTSPKLIVLDVSLLTADSGYEFEQARADRSFWARLTKAAVGAHLANTAEDWVRLHYWKEGVDEVDFVLARGPHLAAIQVDADGSGDYRRGFDAFGVRFPVTREVVVGNGGVPLEGFLSRPAGAWVESDR